MVHRTIEKNVLWEFASFNAVKFNSTKLTTKSSAGMFMILEH